MANNNNTRNNRNTTQKLGWFSSLFITFAGSDKAILRQCSRSEITKHASIGATIFATALLACLSGGYALYTVFKNTNLDTTDTDALKYAIPFGLIWGFFIIFNLDRFIVSTFRKSNETNFLKRTGIELLYALPRIILAIIIAIVISKPIEIKIFESRLAEQIQINKQKAEKTNLEHYQATNQISAKEGKITDLDSKLTSLNEELENGPQSVKDMINDELKPAENSLTNIRNRNNPQINQHRQNITAIRNNSNNYRPDLDADGKEVYVNGKRKESLTGEARDRIRNENSTIGTLNAEINNQQTVVNRINKQITDARQEYKQQKRQEIADKKQEKQDAQTVLTDAKTKADEQTKEANTTSAKAFSNNFVTQLEALGDLTDYKRYEIGSPERAKAEIMSLASLAIMLLFLVVELAPVLTKLITKRGNYDVLLDEEEDKVNFIARHENIANKFLVKELSIAQKEVLKKAIEEWKEKELKNENIVQDYINTPNDEQ